MGKRTEQIKANREYYLSRNRCKYCGRQDARTIIGKPSCFDCLEKKRVRGRDAYPKYAEKHRAKGKELWEQRKAKGFCPICERPVEPSGYVLCAACRAKKRAKNYQRNHENGMLSREEKAARGICVNCDKPVMQGLNSAFKPIRVCDDCYRKSLRSIWTVAI